MSDIEKSPVDSRLGSLSAPGTNTSVSGTTLLKEEVDPESGKRKTKQGGDIGLASGTILMLFRFDLPPARTCTSAAPVAELI